MLLLLRSPEKDFSGGIWEYITGRIRQFEEPEQALRREVKEEAGPQIEIVKPISVFHLFRGEKVAEKELIGITYWVKAHSDKVQLSDEATKFEWVDAQQLQGSPNKA
ncbi:MAG: NUDIX domain-containing protein [Candidatus Woesearchaeota archaeon]